MGRGQAIDCEEQVLYDALTSPRVSSDHIMVMWKERFSWLYSICMKMTSSNTSVQHILRIIELSALLHNYLIEEHDDLLDNWRDDDDISDMDNALSEDIRLNNPVP